MKRGADLELPEAKRRNTSGDRQFFRGLATANSSSVRIWSLSDNATEFDRSISCSNASLGINHSARLIVRLPKSDFVVTAGFYTQVFVWNVTNGNRVHRLVDRIRNVRSLRVVHEELKRHVEGADFCTSGEDHTVRFWKLGEEDPVVKVNVPGIEDFIFLEDCETPASLVYFGKDSKFHFWNMEKKQDDFVVDIEKKKLKVLDEGEKIYEGTDVSLYNISSFSDDEAIFANSLFKKAQIRNSKGKVINEYKGHPSWIQYIARTFDNKILTASKNELRVFDMETSKLLKKSNQKDTGKDSIQAIVVGDDGRVFTGGDDGIVRVWDSRSFECVNRFSPGSEYGGKGISDMCKI